MRENDQGELSYTPRGRAFERKRTTKNRGGRWRKTSTSPLRKTPAGHQEGKACPNIREKKRFAPWGAKDFGRHEKGEGEGGGEGGEGRKKRLENQAKKSPINSGGRRGKAPFPKAFPHREPLKKKALETRLREEKNCRRGKGKSMPRLGNRNKGEPKRKGRGKTP